VSDQIEEDSRSELTVFPVKGFPAAALADPVPSPVVVEPPVVEPPVEPPEVALLGVHWE
jgi:hypothetical protein